MSDYEKLRDEVIMPSIMKLGTTSDYNHTTKITYNIPINKIPLLGWTSATASYNGRYDWRIGHREGNNPPEFGNQIQNSNNRMLTIGLNFNRLFTSIQYVDNVHKKFKKPLDTRFKEKDLIDVEFTKERIKCQAEEKRQILHKLETIDVTAELKDAEGKTIETEVIVDNANKITIIPKTDVDNGVLVVRGKRERGQSPFSIAMEYLTRISTGLQNVNFSYNEDRGSILNGYKEEANYFLGSNKGFAAPGWAYLFGLTDEEFINRALDIIGCQVILTNQL